MGSDGGRGSYAGEREWCRVLERGSLPGLVVAHVHSLLVATSPAATWHLWLVSMKRQGGVLCCLPGLGTTWPPSVLLLHCGRCSMVVVDGLCCRCWWWWEGRSKDVATFEPRLPHLGSHLPRWGIWCFILSYNKVFVAQLVRALRTLLWLRVQFTDIVKLFFT